MSQDLNIIVHESPPGCFRLTDALGREMFPKHSCNYYGVLPGATIFVQVRLLNVFDVTKYII